MAVSNQTGAGYFTPYRTTNLLGYELNPDYQGKGLMNEAIVPVIKYSFGAIGLKTLEAFIHKENNRSISMIERKDLNPA